MTTGESNKGLILVVEDDPDYSEFLCTTLQDSGYETASVLDGGQAMEQVLALQPDVVTLDILMPGKTGISLYRQIRKDEATKKIPVVIITGVGTEGKKLEMARFFHGRSIPDPESVLRKPVEPEALVETIDAIVGQAS